MTTPAVVIAAEAQGGGRGRDRTLAARQQAAPAASAQERRCYFMVGMTKSAPLRMPVGQRVVIVLSFV